MLIKNIYHDRSSNYEFYIFFDQNHQLKCAHPNKICSGIDILYIYRRIFFCFTFPFIHN